LNPIFHSRIPERRTFFMILPLTEPSGVLPATKALDLSPLIEGDLEEMVHAAMIVIRDCVVPIADDCHYVSKRMLSASASCG
jgi:hypothetical protein